MYSSMNFSSPPTIDADEFRKMELYSFYFDQCSSKRQGSDRDMSLKHFQALDRLGKGAFGHVYLVKWSADVEHFYALKVSSKQRLVKKKAHLFIIRERDILQCCDHPNIVRFFSSFQDEANIYLLLEYIDGGDFFDYLERCERISDDQARFYIGQILLVLEYLHACHVIYRDLKAENLMITNRGYLKLIDFGLAKRIVSSTRTICGTRNYLSPEMIRHEKYDQCIDYWALGILMYEMLVGHPPFDGETDEELFEAILNQPIDFSSSFLSLAATDMLQGLLNRNRYQRFGCSKNRTWDIRHHRWFEEHSFSFEQLQHQTLPASYIPPNRKNYSRYPLKRMEAAPLSQSIDEKLFERF